jgi:RNA polymerase sigma-70 factor, ECF subfamily
MSNDRSDDLRALHQRLLDGDRTVATELVPLLLPHLQQRLARLRASVDDPDEVTSQIGLAIAHYLNDPERFDPSRGDLVTYLSVVARGDVLNELDARRRRRVHEVPSSRLVELDPPDRNPTVEETALDAVDPVDIAPETAVSALQALSDLGEEDRKMLELMADRVRATSAYAAVLGISHLPDELQRTAVKRHKDRLQKRLERLRDRLG